MLMKEGTIILFILFSFMFPKCLLAFLINTAPKLNAILFKLCIMLILFSKLLIMFFYIFHNITFTLNNSLFDLQIYLLTWKH